MYFESEALLIMGTAHEPLGCGGSKSMMVRCCSCCPMFLNSGVYVLRSIRFKRSCLLAASSGVQTAVVPVLFRKRAEITFFPDGVSINVLAHRLLAILTSLVLVSAHQNNHIKHHIMDYVCDVDRCTPPPSPNPTLNP